MQAAVFVATTSPRGQTKLQKLNYKPTPKPAACINILLQARARQPQTYFVTNQSTVTGCHLQSGLHLQFVTTTRPRVCPLSPEAQSVRSH